MTSEIFNSLAIFIAEDILSQPDRVLGREDKLISSGLIDSLSLVDIALYVEEEFQVVIDDTELNTETFDTLGELVDLIQSRQHE
jgi:methoxymalonate biosynthesis acyl carrier protein